MSIPILSDIFGSKPDVAGFENVDLGQEQLNAILANLKAFGTGDIAKLGNLYQQYMLGAFGGAGLDLKSLISKGGAAAGQMLDTAKEELGGMVPKDVIDFVRRQTAQQNLGSGIMGSAMGAANWARNLGLTSLDMISKGANLAGSAGNAAQRWAQIASGTILPTQSYLVNPEQMAQNTLQNRLIQRNIQQERNNIAAAPNPIAKGLSDLVAYLTASYIGHGPAGQPPKATDYSSYNAGQEQGLNAAAMDLGQGMGGIDSTSTANAGFQPGALDFGTNAAAPSGVNDTFEMPVSDTAAPGFNYALPYDQPNLYGTTDFNTTNNNQLFWGAI